MTRWGIMATGSIAGVFADALRFTEDAEITAVASRNIGKAQAFAEKFGALRAYGSYEQMACSDGIDVIYIATPMSAHYDCIKLCLENGKNVVCEKSITVNLAELDELIALAREKGLFLMEAMWTKCLPTINKALEWVKEGRIGNIKTLKADFCVNFPFMPKSRLYAKELGGGAMLDLGVYAITFACEFLGYEPKKIMTAGYIGRTDVDFDSTILLCYEGCYADISIGFSTDAPNIATIVGDRGKIRFDGCFMNTRDIKLIAPDNSVIEEYHAEYPFNGYEFEIEETQRSLENGLKESKRVPIGETRAVMKIMDECRNMW